MQNYRFRPAGVFQKAVAAAVCSLLLVGCGGDSAPSDGQVIARLGKVDITVQELENELRLASIRPDQRDDNTIRQVLGQLVGRKYLALKAVDEKLDQEPTVHLDLLRAREQVLANYALQRSVASRSAAIGKAEIDNYILSHPNLFENRKVITVDKITIPLTSNAKQAVEATLNLNSLDEIGRKLSELGMLHNRSIGTVSSNDVSEPVFQTLVNQKPEDVFFAAVGGTGTYFKAKAVENSPLTGDAATELARRQIMAELVREQTEKETASIQASIKYEGKYAKIMEQAPSSTTTPPQPNK